MTVTVLPLLRYDVPHAAWAHRQIILGRPEIVAIDLPLQFQPLLDRYARGKLTEKGLLSSLGKAMGLRATKAGRKASHGQLELSICRILAAAKKAGARAVAIDTSFEALRSEVEGEILATRKGRKAALDRAALCLAHPDTGFLTFFEFAHAPFHFFELLIGHNPEAGPSSHNPDCRICRWGVEWERFFHSFYSVATNLLNPIGEAKYVSAIRSFDRLREKRMVERLMRLHVSPHDMRRIFLVVHMWHAPSIERALRRLKVPLSPSVRLALST